MDKRILITLLLIPATAVILFSQSSEFFNYVDQYHKIAVSEMERAGVPASIKLAQALLESNAGRSELAKRANNHFGMKCGNGWTGKTYEKEDDDYDEFGNLKKSCFRRYRKPEDSYIAHSEFLRDPRKNHIYGFLFKLDPMDYRRWARGLRKAGYATGAGYDDKLINLIETYDLHRYDRMALDFQPGEQPASPDLIAGLTVSKINEVRVVFAKSGMTVQEISLASGIRMNTLRRFNDLLPEPNDTLSEGYRVFLQPKRCKYRGRRKWHYVKKDESMFDISQEYGIKLSKLYKRNRMPEDSQPHPDERIKLKGWKVKESERPRLLSEPFPGSVPLPNDPDAGFLEEELSPQPSVPGPGTVPPDTSGEMYYQVIKGDTLYSISRRYGLTVDQLMKLNNLTSTTLSIGQRLRLK